MAVHRFKPRRKVKRRGARKGGRGRRTRVPRSVGGTNDRGQMARIKETLEFADMLPNTAYNFNFNLSQFVRASALAPLFKWYKASYVEWRIEPTYNTFQEGTTTNTSLPYFYVTMNRTQDTTGINLVDIQAMGAKGQKMTSIKKVSYKPNWCSPGLNFVHKIGSPASVDDTYSLGLRAQYGWLASPHGYATAGVGGNMTPANPTNTALLLAPADILTNLAVYNGHSVWIDQEFGATATIARVTCTVHWEFKDPHYTLSPESAVTLQPL